MDSDRGPKAHEALDALAVGIRQKKISSTSQRGSVKWFSPDAIISTEGVWTWKRSKRHMER